MSRLISVSTTLLVVLATNIFMVSAAIGAPEFKARVGVVKGTTFEVLAGSALLLGTSVTIKCTAGTSKGEITATTTVGNMTMTLSGCESGGKKCKSPGQAEGVLATGTLLGKLGEVEASEADSKVGEVIEPSSGSTYMSVEGCTTATIKGSIIGEIEPTNTLLLGDLLAFDKTGGKQDITKIVGESKEHILEGWELELTDKVDFSKEIEVSGPAAGTQLVALHGLGCRESGGKIQFLATSEACVLLVKNNDAAEAVFVQEARATYAAGEPKCEFLFSKCLTERTPAQTPQCVAGFVFPGTLVAPGGSCWLKYEYTTVPSPRELKEGTFEVKVVSSRGASRSDSKSFTVE